LPVSPEAERRVETWRHWFSIPDAGASGLLELAKRVSAGSTLPGLTVFAEDDRRSWESFVQRATDPAWDWRRRDSRREAALGLASRCDAADLYDSLRLSDPLVATREQFAGTVVTGVVSSQAGKAVEVTLDRLACRLREQAAIEGYRGFPKDVPTVTGRWLRAILSAARVRDDDRLVVTLEDVLLRPSKPPLAIGQRITLRPRTLDPRQQQSGRLELRRRYTARRSWLSGGAAPVPRRRDVPLDVAIAAAE
jgi:hypothetical protein